MRVKIMLLFCRQVWRYLSITQVDHGSIYPRLFASYGKAPSVLLKGPERDSGPVLSSFAVVVSRVGRGRASDARNGAQVFVDGPQITVGHIVVDGPRHDLE